MIFEPREAYYELNGKVTTLNFSNKKLYGLPKIKHVADPQKTSKVIYKTCHQALCL